MAKHEISRIEIERGKNGGFSVTHHFKPKASADRKAPMGISMEHQEPETHQFGSKEHQKLFAHLASALGTPNQAEEAEEAGAGPAARPGARGGFGG